MNNGVRFGWRLAVIAVLCVVLWSTLSYSIKEVADYLESQSYGQNIEDYDYYLYEGKYARMRERLGYGNPRGTEFDLYWDVADAYWCYELCEFWQLVAGNAPLDAGAPLLGLEARAGEKLAAEAVPDAQEAVLGSEAAAGMIYAEKYRQRLLHIYENSGEEAGRYIRSFAGRLLP